MKFNKSIFFILGIGALTLSSCSEGQYWENGTKNPGEAFAFDKSSISVEIPEDVEMPTFYSVSIRRTVAGDEVTVPVLFSSKSDALTGDSIVTFDKGSLAAEYKINIDTALVDKGFNYDAEITLAPVDSILVQEPAANLKLAFSIHQVLTLIWEAAGTARTYSDWFEMSSSDAVVVPVEKAVNYPNTRYDLYRLVSPYWYMAPEYAEEGHDIEFMVNKGSVYKAYAIPEGWQSMGVMDSLEDGTAIDLFIGKTDNGGTISNQRTMYKITAPVGYRDASAGENDPITESSASEVLTFTWTHSN